MWCAAASGESTSQPSLVRPLPGKALSRGQLLEPANTTPRVRDSIAAIQEGAGSMQQGGLPGEFNTDARNRQLRAASSWRKSFRCLNFRGTNADGSVMDAPADHVKAGRRSLHKIPVDRNYGQLDGGPGFGDAAFVAGDGQGLDHDSVDATDAAGRYSANHIPGGEVNSQGVNAGSGSSGWDRLRARREAQKQELNRKREAELEEARRAYFGERMALESKVVHTQFNNGNDVLGCGVPGIAINRPSLMAAKSQGSFAVHGDASQVHCMIRNV